MGSRHSFGTTGRLLLALTLLLPLASPLRADAQTDALRPPNTISASFSPAPPLAFPNPTDSNSPSVWIGDRFVIFNSVAGQTARAVGTSLDDASSSNDDQTFGMAYTDDIGSGRWLESVVADEDTGRLYGWYHNEVPTECPQGVLLWPQIGAAMSDDDGETWTDLGIVVTPRAETVSCDTDHPVTNGGVGDFSVILDHNDDPGTHYAYFLFSSYGGDLDEQGISLARMLWIDRDRPLDPFSGESAVLKWDGQDWAAPGIGGRSTAIFHDADQVSWTSSANNGYWGPSVHWNVDLQTFIVLMNRSRGGNYDPDGIYMTYTATLDAPLSWTQPKRIIASGQGWYPQVVGDPSIRGTDKLAGSRARYFDQGQSTSYVQFTQEPPTAPAPASPRFRYREEQATLR
jgi:hypothetical protein